MCPDHLDWKTRRGIDKQVQRLFRDLRHELQLLDISPSLDAITLVVSGVRGKPLFRRRRKLPGGVTGLSGALMDSDVIVCCSLAEEPLARFSEAHELTHFWGGHFPKVSLPFDIDLFDLFIVQLYNLANGLMAVLLVTGLLSEYPAKIAMTIVDRVRNVDLYHLHNMLVSIVPSVQMPDKMVSMERLLVEIGHARRIIWTNVEHLEDLSVSDEAYCYWDLFTRGIVFQTGGTCAPI
jgi:hypothetical protein